MCIVCSCSLFPGLCWASWIYWFMGFTKFKNLLTLFPSDVFSHHSLPTFSALGTPNYSPWVEWSRLPCTHCAFIQFFQLFHSVFHLESFSIAMTSGSLITSFAACNLLEISSVYFYMSDHVIFIREGLKDLVFEQCLLYLLLIYPVIHALTVTD